MLNKKALVVLYSLIVLLLLPGCYGKGNGSINITDAKMATAVDNNLMPVNPVDHFPKNTSKVFCWFQWKDAKINSAMLAKWRYTTDNINILDYAFAIPRKEGAGSVSFSMPEGKILPSGSYKVDLLLGRRLLKTLAFTIE